jgi:FMN reductase
MAIVTLSGSPSLPSRSGALLQYAERFLARQGEETHAVVVRDLPAEDLLHARADAPAIREAAQRIERAWGVLVATPVYKAAATGILKAFLDVLRPNALHGKLVLPLAVGGSPAHCLAIDYSLKPVLAALGATHILGTLYATEAQLRWDEQGELQLDDDIAVRLEDSLRRFVRLRPGEAQGPRSRTLRRRRVPEVPTRVSA